MKISRITWFEVVVPARKGAIDSSEVSKPLHKLPVGAKSGWSVQFDKISKLILKLELSSGVVGWGEHYRGHDIFVVEDIIKILLGRDINSFILQKLPFTFCREYDGFECALWDAFAKTKGMSIVDLLGGPVREKVKVSAWSSHRTTTDISDLTKRFSSLGYDCVKFKCDLQDDVLAWCDNIAHASPGMKVILDPNERWDHAFEVRKRIDALRKADNVFCLEDPIPRWKISEYAALKSYSSIPVALHVSLPYLSQGQKIQDAINAIQLQAVDGFNFNGGLADFQRMDHIASAAQLPCWHGSEIDLGILEAMYIHSSAAAISCTWPGDIFGRLIREHDLLKTPLKIEPPHAFLPEGAGLGIEPDPDAIAHYQIDKKEYIQP
jgi:muconate cycloisomerase